MDPFFSVSLGGGEWFAAASSTGFWLSEIALQSTADRRNFVHIGGERRALRIPFFEGEEVVFDVERRSGNHSLAFHVAKP